MSSIGDGYGLCRKIKNGVAVLESAVCLPEGTPVQIEVREVTFANWENKTISELAREQKTSHDLAQTDLKLDWPEEDSVDELIALLREVRHCWQT